MSSPVIEVEYEPDEWDDDNFPLDWWVRGTLILIVGIIVSVLTLAAVLNPYDEAGNPRRHGVHRTPPLNLPPCTFYDMTGRPCPSCGMTTSFSLLMHGDILNSLRANAVGTLLAAFCALLVPWCVFSIVKRRTPFVRSLSVATMMTVLSFMMLTLARWGIVLVMGWY